MDAFCVALKLANVDCWTPVTSVDDLKYVWSAVVNADFLSAHLWSVCSTYTLMPMREQVVCAPVSL